MQSIARTWFAGVVLVLFASWQSSASAQTSLTVTAVSDYLFNGVSQTMGDPALQASVDYANEYGIYAGVWGSNVDFGEGTDWELDGYVDLLNERWGFDVGLSAYTYYGVDTSSDINYEEIYAAINYAIATDTSAEARIWYAHDYAGTGAKHAIAALSVQHMLTEQLALTLRLDRSYSLTPENFMWSPSNRGYNHVALGVGYQLHGFDVAVSAESTNLPTDNRHLLLSVSRSF